MNTKDHLNMKTIISLLCVILIGIVLITVKKVSSKKDYMLYLKSEIANDIRTVNNQEQEAPLPFLNGKDWNHINKIKASIYEKTYLKVSLIQIIMETSMFINKPAVKSLSNIDAYISDLDAFYKNADNTVIPVLFALKIIEMQHNKIPNQNIIKYRNMVLEKFNR